MKRIKLNVLAVSVVVIGAALFSACNKSDVNDNNPDVAGLMAFNLATDKTVIIGLSGNQVTNSPLAFNNYTGGYLSIFPGTRSVEAYDYASGDSIATKSFDFEAKKYYSAFVVGTNGSYQNVVVNDNIDSLASGTSYIRYINGINGSSSLGVTIAANGTNVVNTNAGFGNVSEFVAIAPGLVDIAVAEGSISASRNITTEQNKVYTVLLTNGATSADSAQIKYVVNGTLDDANGQRISSSSQTVNIK